MGVTDAAAVKRPAQSLGRGIFHQLCIANVHTSHTLALGMTRYIPFEVL
jgi:hypothetical protein